MLKCGDKFCSNPEVKNVSVCRETVLKIRPSWGGRCFFQKDGAGCVECGGRLIRGSTSKMCDECGASFCG